jgi:hypothetical protein
MKIDLSEIRSLSIDSFCLLGGRDNFDDFSDLLCIDVKIRTFLQIGSFFRGEAVKPGFDQCRLIGVAVDLLVGVEATL